MTVLKVYLSWANSILFEIGKKVDGIQDIQEGRVLCDLINILAPKSCILDNGVENGNPHIYIQTALEHMKANGIKPNFTLQDIIDGDIKSILDCLWQIILNYSVHDIEHNIFRRTVGIGKRNLLEWCQKQLNIFFDGRNTLANNLCADNWFVQLLERFTDEQKEEDRCVYLGNLLKNIEIKYGIIKEIIIPSDIIDGTADEHALMIYIALLSRKTERNKLSSSEIQQYSKEKSSDFISTSPRESPTQHTVIMSQNTTSLRETIGENIIEYMNEDRIDGSSNIIDSPKSPSYLREEEKPIILKRPTDYYNQWESNIDRLSQGPVVATHVTEINSTPEDLLLNIDDFNDSFDKSRSQGEQLYKPDYYTRDKMEISDNQRSESRSPTRIVDRYQNSGRHEYRHSPDERHRESGKQLHKDRSDTNSVERKSRSNVRFHGRRDDRSPSPEAYSHYDDLQQARKDVDKTMPKGNISLAKRSRSDERDYKIYDNQVSERTKALRQRASASLGRENRIRKLNEEKQAYNNNITEDMVRENLGLIGSSSYLPDPVNVITPLRHIGSAERIYKDEESTFIKLLDVHRNPPQPYELGASRVPRREEWERRREYDNNVPYDNNVDLGGHHSFIGSLDREIDHLDTSIDTLERSRKLPRFLPTRNINDKLWSQEFRDISSIRNPYHSLFDIHDDNRHLILETRSRSLSPRRPPISSYERPKSSLGICEPSYTSTFRYEDVGLVEGKYGNVPLGRFDVRTNYYNPQYQSPEDKITSTIDTTRSSSVSPSRQRISLGYSSPVQRVSDEIWGSDLAEIDGLDPKRQEKWKHLINLTDMTNEDVIMLKQALASAIVENDILFAKLTNAKKEFSEKLLKTNEVLDNCRKHLATAQAENQELRTFLNQEKRINAALEARVKELEEKLSITVTNSKQIEMELQETIDELKIVRQQITDIENYQADNDKLRMKVSCLERDNSGMREDLGKMQDTHEKSQSTIHEIRKCLEDVRKERHNLYDEVSQLRFKERYGPTVVTPVNRSSIDIDTSQTRTDSLSLSPRPVRTFKPIIQSPSTSTSQSSQSTLFDRQSAYANTPAIPSTLQSSAATSNVRTSILPSERRSHFSSNIPASDTIRELRTERTHDSRSDTNHEPRLGNTYEEKSHLSTYIPISQTPRLTASSIREPVPLSMASPVNPESLGRSSQLNSALDTAYNYKSAASNTFYAPLTHLSSPFKYSDSATSVPTTYREIYPHRKSRYPPLETNRVQNFENRKTTSNKYTDYPDLQHYPTRLRYSKDDDVNNVSTRQYTSYTPAAKSNGMATRHKDIKQQVLGTDNDVYDEEYEYEYVSKVTTVSDRERDCIVFSEESHPEDDHISRKDGSLFRSSRIRSRSQSPFNGRNLCDEDFSRELDSVFDRHKNFRARSTSPARFPRRGILKNTRSEQIHDYHARSPNPVPTYIRSCTPPTRLSPTNKKTVYITPTSNSTIKSNDVVRSWENNNGVVSNSISPNTRYQIEIDGDLSVVVNGNLNVVANDNMRSAPPPLSDEQRDYANQLIDKYTKPSCSLRTVNM